MKIKLILLIFIISTSTLLSQNLSKGFEYIDTKEYDKALSIFNKAVRKNKDYAVAKFGIAVIYTCNDFHSTNNFKAYKDLKFSEKRLLQVSMNKQFFYRKKYGVSVDAIDSLTEIILNIEFDKALNSNSIQKWNSFIDAYLDTDQSNNLIKYRDSVVFEHVKIDGTLFAYEKYIHDYPASVYKIEAEQLKETAWKTAYYKAYRSLEFNSIKQFQQTYPQYPYYDDSSQIYVDLANRARQLNLHLGFLQTTVAYYGDFIKDAAPHEMAYQTLLCLIQPQLDNNQIDDALDTINKYSLFFNNHHKIDTLISILNRPDAKITSQGISPTINSDNYEYMPVITADGQTLYFCGQDRIDNIGGEDVFFSNLDNGNWSDPVIIDRLSTSFGNEAPLSISADGNSLIVFSNGDVFISDKTNNGWSRMRPLTTINTRQYWEADAYFSPDGNAIFFSSDRNDNIGGFHKFSDFYHGDYIGNLDLYVIEKQSDGSWSDPINLGATINTPYAERTPFLHADMKTMYFASDGHAGVGKMDVFKCTRLSDTSWTQWSEPINLGLGINTSKKEYGYKISTDGEKAYFTKFADNQSDIHYIYLPEDSRPDKVAIVQGVVTDINGNPLQADIIWEDLDANIHLGALKTDPNSGEYIITLPLGKNYGFFVSKQEYYPVSDNLDLSDFDKNITVVKNFQLTDEQLIIQGQTTIQLNNVFFDFDRYELKNTSFPELNRLADFIKLHPNIKIEISGHTDNKGTDQYNSQLSQNRANSVKDYLIMQGCNENQLISKGYGASKPIADNSTDSGRQQNRRVEFQVIQ